MEDKGGGGGDISLIFRSSWPTKKLRPSRRCKTAPMVEEKGEEGEEAADGGDRREGGREGEEKGEGEETEEK